MKEKLMQVWAKIVENRDTVITVAAVVVGAALGAVVANVVANAREESFDQLELDEDLESEDAVEDETE